MPRNVEVTKDEKLGQIISVLCSNCTHFTKHEIVASYDISGSDINPIEGWGVEWVDNYQIIKCRGCETVTFRQLNWYSDAVDPMSGDDGRREKLYPFRSIHCRSVKDFRHIPRNIEMIYSEVIECYNSDSSTLCAAGLRAIVEGICVDKKILHGPVEYIGKNNVVKKKISSDLQGKIAGLKENGLLTEADSNNLHAYRFLGNDAVHKLARPSTRELKLAIDLIEHLLESIYEVPRLAAELAQEGEARRSRLPRSRKSSTRT